MSDFIKILEPGDWFCLVVKHIGKYSAAGPIGEPRAFYNQAGELLEYKVVSYTPHAVIDRNGVGREYRLSCCVLGGVDDDEL